MNDRKLLNIRNMKQLAIVQPRGFLKAKNPIFECVSVYMDFNYICHMAFHLIYYLLTRIEKYKKAGFVLRGARYRENMSQIKLAQKSGVHQNEISKIENGKRTVGEKVASSSR